VYTAHCTRKQDHQGVAESVLALVVGSAGQTWSGKLQTPPALRHTTTATSSTKQLGTITVRAEEVSDQNIQVHLQLRAQQLVAPRKGGDSPYLRISRIGESGAAVPCCKTEVKAGQLR
jgi:hypothetical protein